jgi:hypothetical protein
MLAFRHQSNRRRCIEKKSPCDLRIGLRGATPDIFTDIPELYSLSVRRVPSSEVQSWQFPSSELFLTRPKGVHWLNASLLQNPTLIFCADHSLTGRTSADLTGQQMGKQNRE